MEHTMQARRYRCWEPGTKAVDIVEDLFILNVEGYVERD